MGEEAREPAVYKVRAGAAGVWDVYDESSSQPVASFQDKSAALAYAMGLARGRISWHLLLGASAESPRNGFGSPQRA